MLSRAARPALRAAAAAPSRAAAAGPSTAATYATLREIETRLKSIRNIEKITNTMKVVASTKLTRATRSMNDSRKYGEASNEPSAFDLVIIGEKCKAQLQRTNGKDIQLTFAGVGKDIPTFADAQAIADQIVLLPNEYTDVKILYNKFINATSYEPSFIEAFSEESIAQSPNLSAFEVEDESLGNLREYSLANSLYWALAEGHACEQSARRNAMENASKNAGEMIGKYQILYNRTRQAVITGELVEIITGAIASEEM
ncbi:F1 complex, gamma subunit of ATPase [Trichoderma longibrachiatum ATCC 18648]|uniref:ATP synthase subunit gamma, mitochondrial n=1 Tax=Trichoderma longibrachiatum ATCC 18648 TaxID=983965 RepID=A0A2T4CJ06_TRILO|nr:F1 complex, gamma subunit of ATPase [Trichoderma longibrachiatum ATCC 18648]